VIAVYPTWWNDAMASLDSPRAATGQWQKSTIILREADLEMPHKQGPGQFAVKLVHSEDTDLKVRSVRLVGVTWPKEAWQAVVKAYEEEITQRKGEWTIPFYQIAIARIMAERLGQPDQAAALLEQVKQDYPESEALDLVEGLAKAQRGIGQKESP
jgi:hypothetical protein